MVEEAKQGDGDAHDACCSLSVYSAINESKGMSEGCGEVLGI